MTTPTFTAPPTAPQRTDTPAVFRTRAAAFVAWFTTLYNELVAAIAWMVDGFADVDAAVISTAADAVTAETAAAAVVSVTNYFTTNANNLTIGAGAKALTGLPGTLAAVNGHRWYLIDPTNPGNRMYGALSAVNLGAGTATFTVPAGGFAGAGTIASWILMHAALAPLMAGTAADMLLGTSEIAGITADALYDSLVEATLYRNGSGVLVTGSGAGTTLDFSTFDNGVITLGGNVSVPNPTSMKPGQTGRITFIQDGTGGRTVSWGAQWHGEGVIPAVASAAGAITIFEYDARTATYVVIAPFKPT